MTTTATATRLRYEPIPAAYLDQVRAAGHDEAGNPLAVQVVGPSGNPLRCCLRDSRPGERVVLIAYTPPGGAGPYAERGPVFVHAEPCDGYDDVGAYPPALIAPQADPARVRHQRRHDRRRRRRRDAGRASSRGAARPARRRGGARAQHRRRLLQLLRPAGDGLRRHASRVRSTA